jgi:radical SAM superfamily enzyme YgiQ (UPF0313 family)/pyruvate-formate lyase-activating enzyme
MKVLFINPPILLPSAFAHYPTFSNIGMLYNAGFAEKYGFDVDVMDAFYMRGHLNYRAVENDLYHLGAELEDIDNELGQKKADCVIITATMFSDLHRMNETLIPQVVEIARKNFPGAFIIVADLYVCGMNYFPYDPVKVLGELREADCIIAGEADHKLIEVLKKVENGNSLEGISHTASRTGKRISYDPSPYPVLENLDELPAPAFHLLDMDNYFSCLADAMKIDLVHEYHKPLRAIPILTSRGCKFFCYFCTQQVLRLHFRGHSTEYLSRLLSELNEKYRVERFFFIDNNINLDSSRFSGLVRMMAEKGFAWDAVNGFRADLLKADDIELIAKAGNDKITVSAESGDPKVLREIVNKKLQLKDIVNVAKACQKIDLPSQVHYIIGIPGETKRQINNTLEFALMLYEIHGAFPLLQHAIPFRSTGLFKTCEEKGYFSKHPDNARITELEQVSLITTPDFTADEVNTFKANFISLRNAMEWWTVVDMCEPCNNNCVHCEISYELKQRQNPAPHDQLIRQMDRKKRYGGRELLIRGGEPTLAGTEALCRILEHAGKIGLKKKTIATNCRMFAYSGFAKNVVNSGLNRVITSIHSLNPHIHDSITGVSGSFNQTAKGIENLKKEGVEVETIFRMTKISLPEITSTLAFLKSSGIKSVHLRYPAPLGNLAEEKDTLIAPLRQVKKVINNAVLNFPDMDIKIQGIPFCLVQGLKSRIIPYPFFQLPKIRQMKAKSDKCTSCTEYILCFGYYREEFQKYYQELRA